MEWILKCETPVHIGTGRNVEPYEYHISGGRYLVFDLKALLARLDDEQPGAAERYADYCSTILLQAMQQAKTAPRRQRRVYASDAGMIPFCERELKNRQLAGSLLTDPSVVKYSADGVAWTPRGRHRRVREAIKANGQPFIPGTSVKGALRTALAYAILVEQSGPAKTALLDGVAATDIHGIRAQISKLKDDYGRLAETTKTGGRELENAVKDIKRRRAAAERTIGQTVEEVLFRWGSYDQKRRRWSYQNPQQDLWRFVHISDSTRSRAWFTVGEIRASAARLASSPASEIPIPAELLDAGSAFQLTIRLDACALQAASRAAVAEEKRSNGQGQWRDFRDKFTWMFGRQPESLLQLAKPEARQAWADEVLQQMLKRASRHSLAVLDRDEQWIQRKGSHTLQEPIQQLRQTASEALLFRMGFSSGWHATTVALALEEWGESGLLDDMLYVFLMDLPQNAARLFERPWEAVRAKDRLLELLSRRSDSGRFPTSRRLLYLEQEPESFLGWFSLSAGELQGGESRQSAQESVERQQAKGDSAGRDQISAQKLAELRRHFHGT